MPGRVRGHTYPLSTRPRNFRAEISGKPKSLHNNNTILELDMEMPGLPTKHGTFGCC